MSAPRPIEGSEAAVCYFRNTSIAGIAWATGEGSVSAHLRHTLIAFALKVESTFGPASALGGVRKPVRATEIGYEAEIVARPLAGLGGRLRR
jgi:hypothetical protein